MRKTLAALTLALLTVLALPLAAADLPTEPIPTLEVDTVPEAAAFDLEAVLDDGRVSTSCNFFECYQSCLAQYGEGVQSSCVGGTWYGTCVCYP